MSLGSLLAQAAHAAPSADNSQPFQFGWDGTTFSIRFSAVRGSGKLFGANAHPTLLSLGAAVDNALAASAMLGVRPRLTLTADQLSGDPCALLEFDKLPDRLPTQLEHPLFARHTNRFPYRHDPLPAHVITALQALPQGKSRLNILTEKRSRSELVALTRSAAEARFCSEDLHRWLMDSLRFTPEDAARGDGLDLATLSLPPGGGLFLRFIADWKRMSFLNRIGAYKALALTETMLLGAAPALICICGQASEAGAIDAGRLLAQVWTELNRQGLAAHPYYVVTDQLLRLEAGKVPEAMQDRIRNISARLPELLGMPDGELLHMMLRVGYPRKTPPRSQRLPLSQVFEEALPTAAR